MGGGIACVLTGWGYTNVFRFGGPPNNLQRIFLDTLTNEQCMQDGQAVDQTGICTQGSIGSGACGVSERLWLNVLMFNDGDSCRATLVDRWPRATSWWALCRTAPAYAALVCPMCTPGCRCSPTGSRPTHSRQSINTHYTQMCPYIRAEQMQIHRAGSESLRFDEQTGLGDYWSMASPAPPTANARIRF